MTSSSRTGALAGPNRVPEPGTSFWAVKVLTTGMGETTSDYLVKTFAPELVVPLALVVLLAVLLLQMRTRAYRPGRYWTTALMVSVFGTMAADVLHVGLGVPYALSTAGFAVALAAVFTTWWLVERNLSVHDISTARREGFYWATVMATFALGTALGDLTASSLGLGYLGSGFLFLTLFSLPGLVFLSTRRAAVATFWCAYVLTRPLGASLADWLAVPQARGGLDLGPGPVSGCLLIVFIVLVGLLAFRARSGRGPGSPVGVLRAGDRRVIDGTAVAPALTLACCEDDPAITRLLDECFATAGHTALFARSGSQAVERFADDDRIDVLVLDIGLPDMDGRDLCRVLRANGQSAPALFLSALGQVHDIVQGFAAGGLDYVVKPFAVPELLARIESLGRRRMPTERIQGLRLDPHRFALCNDDTFRQLTPTEFRIAAELLAHAGRLVRRNDLVSAAWVPGAQVNGNTLDTYLHRLRRCLAELGAEATIHTVRGVGYILRGT